MNQALSNKRLHQYRFILPWTFAEAATEKCWPLPGFNRRLRQTARPVVTKAHWVQAPWAHPIRNHCALKWPSFRMAQMLTTGRALGQNLQNLENLQCLEKKHLWRSA